jgi:hypothetical protein
MAIPMSSPQISRQVFIGGCSRSGTTLLGAMLGQNRCAVTTPESHFKFAALPANRSDLDEAVLRKALEVIERHWRFKIWETEVDTEEILAESAGTSYRGLLCSLVGRYAIRVGRPEANTWVDHTPENVTYGLALRELFPDARFIHIVRDGRGVASSILPLDWGPNTVSRAAHWWVESVSHGLALEMALDETRIRRVHYEDLVSNPGDTLREICAFLEMDYSPEMIEAAGFVVPDYTAPQHEMIGRKPSADRAVRWKKALTPRQIERFEHETRDFLAYLGYRPVYGSAARGAGIREIVGDALVDAYRASLTNKVRWLRRGASVWLSYRRQGQR